MYNSNRSPLLWVFLFFAGIYCFLSIGHFGGDGIEDYLTAESLVLDGNITLDDRPGDPDELNINEKFDASVLKGNKYSSRGGFTVFSLLSVFYLAGHLFSGLFKSLPHDYITMFFVSFYNPVISAINATLIYCISIRLELAKRTCFFLAVIFAFSTMMPVYARTGFQDPTLIMFLLISILFLLSFSDTEKIKFYYLSAISAGLCINTKVVGIVFIPGLLVYLFLFSKEKNRGVLSAIFEIVKYASVVSLFFILSMLFNYYTHGDILGFGGYNMVKGANRIISSPFIMKGFYYYFFSTGKSLFLYNLPVLLAFSGMAKVPGAKSKEKIMFIIIAVCNILFFVKSFRRGSLFSWGPRYLMPAVSMLIFFVGFYYERSKGMLSRFFVYILSILGALIMFPCMFINQSQFYFFVKNELNLDEYLINFIPDLSPIMGAWHMFLSKILGHGTVFIYHPDYRLTSPLTGDMAPYNYFDMWFLKIVHYYPLCRIHIYFALV